MNPREVRDNPAIYAILELVHLLEPTSDTGGILLIARCAMDAVQRDSEWWRAHSIALAGLDLAGGALDDVLFEWLAAHSEDPAFVTAATGPDA